MKYNKLQLLNNKTVLKITSTMKIINKNIISNKQLTNNRGN